MKIKTLKLAFVFIFFLAFFSCGCVELYFDKNETYWTDAYKKGDILVFESSSSNKDSIISDTIFIDDKRISTPTGECNLLVSKYDKESCVIDYKYKHKGKLSEYNYFVQHVKEKKGESIPVLRVYDLEYSKSELKDTTVVLNKINITLNDCYAFHKEDCYQGWSDFKIKTFVWSKKLGLVIFTGINGEKFELIKKIRKP